jgi:hypothetical protein
MSLINGLVGFVFPNASDLLDLTADIVRHNREERKKARDEKQTLLAKLGVCSGEEIFKYMNLISFASMDECVAEARLQAQQSFKMCLIASVGGFLMICISVAFALVLQLGEKKGLEASYLGAAAGLITEAISAIFFVLYARTTSQVNRLHDRILGSQTACCALLSMSLVSDVAGREKQIIDLSNRLIARTERLDMTPSS